MILLHRASNFIKKEAPTLVFFCDFFEIFKSTYILEHLRTVVCVPKKVDILCTCSTDSLFRNFK